MKITTKRQVWLTVVILNLIAAVIVAAAIITFYPPEEWPFELAISMALTFGIGVPMTWFMANQFYKNSLLNIELQRLVNRDRLTDMATRDYFFGRMAAAPDAFGVSLMVDIDHFKQVNDTYGHFAGDQVIQHVARLMREIVRSQDIVARFGGEEFVVFLYDADIDKGYQIAERMRAAIAANSISFEEFQVSVTVSIGGSLKEACDDIDQAIREADAALYRAKNLGRNRTIFAKDTPADTHHADAAA